MLDVVLKNGAVQLSDAVTQFQTEFGRMKEQQLVLDASFTGVQLACIFVEHDDVSYLKIEFCPSAEFDDQGGSYRSVSLRCLVCQDAQGHEIEFDEKLDVTLEDVREEIYDTLAGPYDSHDVTIELKRESIQAMLDAGEISGLKALKSLLPDLYVPGFH